MATTDPSTMLAHELRERLVAACSRLLSSVAPNVSVGIILSGGVDTAAILYACEDARARHGRAMARVSHAITVLASSTAPDREFAVRLAEEFKLKHCVVETTAKELVAQGPTLRNTVQILQSFDPMNIRNSLVIERALQEAQRISREEDVILWLTGDAADELLGGYSFTWKAEEPQWTRNRNKMCSSMAFSADRLSEAKSLIVQSPFRDKDFVDWVMVSCPREVCLGERNLIARLGDDPIRIFTGKVCLRDAFPESISSMRRKDPIEVGSGSTLLSEPGFFDSILSTEKQTALREVAKSLGIELSDSLEQMVYFEVFIEEFPNLKGLINSKSSNPAPGYCKGCRFYLFHDNFCRSEFSRLLFSQVFDGLTITANRSLWSVSRCLIEVFPFYLYVQYRVYIIQVTNLPATL